MENKDTTTTEITSDTPTIVVGEMTAGEVAAYEWPADMEWYTAPTTPVVKVKQTLWQKAKTFTYNNRFMVGYALGTIVIVALFGFVSLVTP